MIMIGKFSAKLLDIEDSTFHQRLLVLMLEHLFLSLMQLSKVFFIELETLTWCPSTTWNMRFFIIFNITSFVANGPENSAPLKYLWSASKLENSECFHFPTLFKISPMLDFTLLPCSSLEPPNMVLGWLGVGLVVEPFLIAHFPLFFITLVICDWPCHNSKRKVK